MNPTQQAGVTGRREKQKAETNALILKTSKNLFEELGFEKTTMRKIALEAEISPGAIFKHFENKSVLLAAALFNDIEAVQQNALEHISQQETVQTHFLFVARQFFTYYAQRPALSKMLVKHSLFIEGEWAEKLYYQTCRLTTHLAGLIDGAKEKGLIKKSVDSRLLAYSYFSHYLFVLIKWVKEPPLEPESALEALSPLIDHASSGVATK